MTTYGSSTYEMPSSSVAYSASAGRRGHDELFKLLFRTVAPTKRIDFLVQIEILEYLGDKEAALSNSKNAPPHDISSMNDDNNDISDTLAHVPPKTSQTAAAYANRDYFSGESSDYSSWNKRKASQQHFNKNCEAIGDGNHSSASMSDTLCNQVNQIAALSQTLHENSQTWEPLAMFLSEYLITEALQYYMQQNVITYFEEQIQQESEVLVSTGSKPKKNVRLATKSDSRPSISFDTSRHTSEATKGNSVLSKTSGLIGVEMKPSIKNCDVGQATLSETSRLTNSCMKPAPIMKKQLPLTSTSNSRPTIQSCPTPKIPFQTDELSKEFNKPLTSDTTCIKDITRTTGGSGGNIVTNMPQIMSNQHQQCGFTNSTVHVLPEYATATLAKRLSETEMDNTKFAPGLATSTCTCTCKSNADNGSLHIMCQNTRVDYMNPGAFPTQSIAPMSASKETQYSDAVVLTGSSNKVSYEAQQILTNSSSNFAQKDNHASSQDDNLSKEIQMLAAFIGSNLPMLKNTLVNVDVQRCPNKLVSLVQNNAGHDESYKYEQFDMINTHSADETNCGGDGEAEGNEHSGFEYSKYEALNGDAATLSDMKVEDDSLPVCSIHATYSLPTEITSPDDNACLICQYSKAFEFELRKICSENPKLAEQNVLQIQRAINSALEKYM